jgi:hypothetical protein
VRLDYARTMGLIKSLDIGLLFYLDSMLRRCAVPIFTVGVFVTGGAY